MSEYFSILAASGDDQVAKLIFGVIVAIIWGIGALVTQAKKKQKEGQQRQQQHDNWSRIEQEMRERAVRAQSALQQQPGVPPLPPPPPTFAPTRSIQGPYLPQ